MNNVQYLIISTTIDYSTDLICYGLEKENCQYLRINRDRFSSYLIEYDLENDALVISIEDNKYKISQDLKSVYFRAPVFLRTIKNYTVEEQLYRSQWSAFIRNLIILDNAKWINHPVNTYRAENKLYQLKLAKQVGLYVPETYVGNSIPKNLCEEDEYIIKSLDTALFYDKGQEMFTYTTMVKGRELLSSEIQYAPIIIQECLDNKLDIRVTVVDNEIFPVSITAEGKEIRGDWRKIDKLKLKYTPITLPYNVKCNIIRLMNDLGLTFGGVDLIFANNKYYFIEVNPTGEWGWLKSVAKLPIDQAIVKSMIGEISE